LSRPTDQQVSQWYPRLYRTALRMTGSHDDAADLTQQAFLKALDRWGSFNGQSRPTTWLHRILVNCVTDFWRQRRTRPVQNADEWVLSQVSSCPDGACGDNDEPAAELRRAIDALPPAQRTAFVATVIDGYTYEEAANLLDVPVGTIGSRVCQARRQLGDVMRRQFPEGIS